MPVLLLEKNFSYMVPIAKHVIGFSVRIGKTQNLG